MNTKCTSTVGSGRFGGAITALITPMTPEGVDYASYEKLVNWQIESGIDGLVPTGTTGESVTLSHQEHDDVVRKCVEVAAGRVPVIAGSGSNNTTEAIRLSQVAQASGADALLIVTPYYNKPDQRGIVQHYKMIHDETDIPIIVYDIPSRSVVGINDETMAELASLPRVLGVKDARGMVHRVDALSRLCGEDFVQLTGEDPSALGYWAHGGHGVISVTANAAPSYVHGMWQAVCDGDYQTARSINRRLSLLHRAMFWEPSPAAAKYACWRAGIIADPHLRSPIMPLSEATRALIDDVLDACQPK